MSFTRYLWRWARARLSRLVGANKCPICRADLQHGFGLAGGGYGPYSWCDTTGCRFFAKRESED